MTHLDTEELGGATLQVYAYLVKEGKPVGPREVMRGAHLSSPSTAYRQLQKLESFGLIKKNIYGAYVVREKAHISGHVWIGRNLVPRLMCYSLFFMGVVGIELAIIAIQFIQGQIPTLELIYLAATNTLAMGLFFGEGFTLWRKNKPEDHEAAKKESPVDSKQESERNN
ncbi:MAG: hypothetical protein ACQXXJ_04055 [Candidatus Bathyarchaeia archaeon]|jgi:hypothetical protein